MNSSGFSSFRDFVTSKLCECCPRGSKGRLIGVVSESTADSEVVDGFPVRYGPALFGRSHTESILQILRCERTGRLHCWSALAFAYVLSNGPLMLGQARVIPPRR